MNKLSIEPYAPSDWPGVEALLCDWPFKPLAGHARWPISDLTALCLARAEKGLQNSQARGWVARSAGTIKGFSSLSLLPWDTEQIGLGAVRLDYLIATGTYDEQCGVKRALLSTVVQHCDRQSLQHLSVRLDGSDLSGLHMLESAGFITMDGILTFALELPDLLPYEPDGSLRIRLAGPADSAEAAAVASDAYVYDRFHTDPEITKERADALHAVWLRNSCLGKAADAVVVAEDETGLLGFVTCKLQRDTELHLESLVGTIVLVATAGRARRRGIAGAATRAALDWFRGQGVEIVEVGTQLRNIPASRLYQSLGFRLVGSGISLRKML